MPVFDPTIWILFGILGLLLLGLLGMVIVSFLARRSFHMIFDRPFPRPLVDRSPSKIDQNSLFGRGQNWFYTNRLDFLDLSITAYDGVRLSAYYRPAERKDSRQLVILLHGWRDAPSAMGAFTQLYLQKADCHILILHLRAHGMSDGKYTGFGLAESQDLITWILYMRKILGKDLRIICHGRSMGAAAVLMAAGSGRFPSEVKGIVADSSFSSLYELVRVLMKRRYHIAPKFFLREISRMAGKRVEYKIERISPISRASKIRVPVLLIHGSDDSFIPPSHADAIFSRIRSPKRLLFVEGAGHVETLDVAPSAFSTEIDRLLEASGFFL